MFETAHLGEDHRGVALVAGLYSIRITQGSAGLHDGRDSLIQQRVDPVPEWEKRIRSRHGARQSRVPFGSFILDGFQCADILFNTKKTKKVIDKVEIL